MAGTLVETLENRIATLLWARTVRGQLTSWEQAEGVAADIHALLAAPLDPLGLEAAADLFQRFERARTRAGGPGQERYFEELRADERAAWEAVASNYETEED